MANSAAETMRRELDDRWVDKVLREIYRLEPKKPKMLDEIDNALIRELKVMRGVYFVQDTIGNIKIGYSARIQHRVSSLQTGCSMKLSLVGVIKNASIDDESSIHENFEKDRIRGEWYKQSEKLFSFMFDNCDNYLGGSFLHDHPRQSAVLRRDVHI
jgi:hypothetical protein